MRARCIAGWTSARPSPSRRCGRGCRTSGSTWSSPGSATVPAGSPATPRGGSRPFEPLVVGGTGLYVRALAEGLFHEPPLDPERRERLRAWAARLPAARLAHWAARLDPRFSGVGRQRAARAVEVALLTGRALSWWQAHARA